MENTSPRIRTLLRQAERVAKGGKRAAAEQLYRDIIDEAPDSAAAWAGLGSVLTDQAAKEAAYDQALAIDPENEKAVEGLQRLLGAGQDVTEDEEQSHEDKDLLKDTSQVKSEVHVESGQSSHQIGYKESPEITHTSETRPDDGHYHSDVSSETRVLYCANHPGRETHLRCNKCGKPICSSCAQPTPVGYRCPECIREHEDIFYTATPLDYVIAVLVALPLSLFAGLFAPRLSFFVIFLGAIIGSLIGRIVFRAVGRRRGRGLPQLVSAIVIVGAILPLIPQLFAVLLGGLSFGLIGLIWPVVYMVTASGAAYYQMR